MATSCGDSDGHCTHVSSAPFTDSVGSALVPRLYRRDFAGGQRVRIDDSGEWCECLVVNGCGLQTGSAVFRIADCSYVDVAVSGITVRRNDA